MSGTSLCVYLYDKTKTKAIGMKKVGFQRVLGDNTVWGWRLGGFGEKVAIGEGSVRPQVPGEMAPFIPPGITESLFPPAPSFLQHSDCHWESHLQVLGPRMCLEAGDTSPFFSFKSKTFRVERHTA